MNKIKPTLVTTTLSGLLMITSVEATEIAENVFPALNTTYTVKGSLMAATNSPRKTPFTSRRVFDNGILTATSTVQTDAIPDEQRTLTVRLRFANAEPATFLIFDADHGTLEPIGKGYCIDLYCSYQATIARKNFELEETILFSSDRKSFEILAGRQKSPMAPVSLVYRSSVDAEPALSNE